MHSDVLYKKATISYCMQNTCRGEDEGKDDASNIDFDDYLGQDYNQEAAKQLKT